MKNIMVVTIVVLAGIIAYLLIFHKPQPPDNTRFERRAFWDSVTIAQQDIIIKQQQDTIEYLKSSVDTVIEKIKIFKRDTVLIKKYIEKDDTCSKLLRQQEDYIELQRIGIKRLQTLNDEQDKLISSLNTKISIMRDAILNKDEYIKEQRKQHKKELRKTKLIAAGVTTGGIVLSILLITTR